MIANCGERGVGSHASPGRPVAGGQAHVMFGDAMADPLTAADETLPALELVLEHARRYLADVRGPVREEAADDAARSFTGSLPDEGSGTLAVVRHLLEQGTHAQLLARCVGYERLVTAYAREAAERAALAAEEDDIGADFDDDYTPRDSGDDPRRDQVEEVSR